MQELNPYEALTQKREGSFSEESIEKASQLRQDDEARQSELAQPKPTTGSTEPAPSSEPAPNVEQEQEQRETEAVDGVEKYIDTLKSAGEATADIADNVNQFVMSSPAGTVDFAIDALNTFTPLELPKLPKFENRMAQAFRDLASFVIPTTAITMATGGAGAAAQAKVGFALGRDALFKMFAGTGISIGSGAFVDYTNALSKEGDNASAALRKNLPELFWWIPDNIATLDSDSPDIKRDKSVKEGAILGLFTDLLLGAATIVRGIKSLRSAGSKFIPENETAEAFWKDPAKFADKTKTELPTPSLDVRTLSKAETGDEMLALLEASSKTANDSAQARFDALDELGTYNSSKDPTLDEPMLGVNNEMFDATEQGIRSVDPEGVHGAAVDAARIKDNNGTVYGRMGSIVSEAALKHGLDADSITKRDFINLIKKTLRDGGKYSYKGLVKVTSQQIQEAGEELAAVLFDPRIDVQSMKAILEDYKNVTEGVQNLDQAGYQGVLKAMKSYVDEYFNLDTLKAQAYVTHSLAGQVSDMAEGMRLMDGTDAVERAQEQIIDRITYLMAEKGLASYLAGSTLANMNLWKRIKNMSKKAAGNTVDEITNTTEIALSKSVKRAQQYRDTLNNLRLRNPEFLKPLMQVNELTDGNVDSMYKLNHYVMNKLGTFGKSIIDLNPEIQSDLINGAYGNLYNSILSAIRTPIKAATGNAVMLMEKPIATFIGALSARDLQTLRRGWYQYSALFDSFQKGLGHLGMVFRKASYDPNSVPYIVREDIFERKRDSMEVLRGYADAAALNGEMGPQILLDKAMYLDDLSNHPVLRWGVNAMTALDGFSKAVIANAEARGLAYDDLIKSGEPLNSKTFKEASDQYYRSMFDGDGFIADKAVDYMTREVALSLDSPLSKSLSGLINHIPALKPFLMFPRTSANILSQAWNRSLLSAFMGDYNRIIGLRGKIHSTDEIEEILKSRNIPYDEHALVRFKGLQAEIRGRVAIGAIAVTAAGGMMINDRLRGDGHYDKERNNVRKELGWKPRTYKGWDGNWYSYADLGPVADWLAITADIMDNFDLMSSHAFEDFQRKAGFILGAVLVNRSPLQGLEPMMDVLAGNPSSGKRWAASTVSGVLPLSGMRNELGRLLYPELTVLDEELGDYLRNRNRLANLVDPEGRLPTQHDWIDGTPINRPENFLERVVNTYMPVSISKGISKERQFLIDLEYDARPTFAKSKGGVTLTAKQRAEIMSIMGRDGMFLRKLKEIKKEADRIDMIGRIKQARRQFRSNEDVIIEKFGNIYGRLDLALREAKEAAEMQLSDIDSIRAEEAEIDLNNRNNQYGILTNK